MKITSLRDELLKSEKTAAHSAGRLEELLRQRDITKDGTVEEKK